MSMRVGVLSSEKDQAIQEVKEAMKTNKDLRMHQRYQVILMVLHGETYEKIASITGQSRATLYNYSNAYRLNGLAGLDRGRPPGRKSFLTPEQEQQVYEMIVHQKPVDVGFPVEMNWTSPLIRKWIKQTFDVSYSDRGTRKLLERLGLRFTKPTYTLEKADPAKQEVFKEQFENVKKNY